MYITLKVSALVPLARSRSVTSFKLRIHSFIRVYLSIFNLLYNALESCSVKRQLAARLQTTCYMLLLLLSIIASIDFHYTSIVSV